jgi:hypothetical protein
VIKQATQKCASSCAISPGAGLNGYGSFHTFKRRLTGNAPEIAVNGQHHQIVMNTQLSQQGLDRSNLHPGARPPSRRAGRPFVPLLAMRWPNVLV